MLPSEGPMILKNRKFHTLWKIENGEKGQKFEKCKYFENGQRENTSKNLVFYLVK